MYSQRNLNNCNPYRNRTDIPSLRGLFPIPLEEWVIKNLYYGWGSNPQASHEGQH